MQNKYLFRIFAAILIAAAVATRFYGLDWGLPYPFHPDERNMAVALMGLTCTNFPADCFNPHFFAYGQLPLYLGYFMVKMYQFIFNPGGGAATIGFAEAVMALRVISATASVATVLITLKIMQMLAGEIQTGSRRMVLAAGGLLAVFSPALIQFAHFGTTESLLMLGFCAMTYICLLYLKGLLSYERIWLWFGIVLGLSVAVKVSALVFVLLPIYVLLAARRKQPVGAAGLFFTAAKMGFTALVVAFLASPYNFIAFNDFISSIRYESAVGTGQAKVFYTRQFEDSVPVIFQFTRIFPYALGLPVFALFLAGFFIGLRNRYLNFIRFAWLAYFISNAFLYAKWTRFMAPDFPIMIILAFITFTYFARKTVNTVKNLRYLYRAAVMVTLFICIIPGIGYLAVYSAPQVSIQASEWMMRSIPAGSRNIQEAGNVIDLPLDIDRNHPGPLPSATPVNLYDVESDRDLQMQIASLLAESDYLIVPSRRVFANYTCQRPGGETVQMAGYFPDHCARIQAADPFLTMFYSTLFSGRSGFNMVHTITSFPRISFLDRTLWQLDDENAEETWTVFDHPVIRFYRR